MLEARAGFPFCHLLSAFAPPKLQSEGGFWSSSFSLSGAGRLPIKPNQTFGPCPPARVLQPAPQFLHAAGTVSEKVADRENTLPYAFSHAKMKSFAVIKSLKTSLPFLMALSLWLEAGRSSAIAQTNQSFDGRPWNVSSGNLSVSFIQASPIGAFPRPEVLEAPPST